MFFTILPILPLYIPPLNVKNRGAEYVCISLNEIEYHNIYNYNTLVLQHLAQRRSRRSGFPYFSGSFRLD
jgi:hypothetical protein